MFNIWIAPLVSVVIVSLISLVGVITLSLNMVRFKQVILYFVSFAAGAMLGDAFIHLVPEAFQKSSFFLQSSVYILVGIVIFFILEKIIFWRHCHLPPSKNHIHPVGTMNLIGDGVHNFMDGIIVAASYLVSIPLGIATTIAVVLHEIPQEIGDFGVLIHAGYSKNKAIFYNFLSATAAILGTVLTVLIGTRAESIVDFLIPFTIGGFIYIAAADLIPEIHHENRTERSILQLIFFVMGIVVMALLLFLD
jgi:zinc and cadmium transporter